MEAGIRGWNLPRHFTAFVKTGNFYESLPIFYGMNGIGSSVITSVAAAAFLSFATPANAVVPGEGRAREERGGGYASWIALGALMAGMAAGRQRRSVSPVECEAPTLPISPPLDRVLEKRASQVSEAVREGICGRVEEIFPHYPPFPHRPYFYWKIFFSVKNGQWKLLGPYDVPPNHVDSGHLLLEFQVRWDSKYPPIEAAYVAFSGHSLSAIEGAMRQASLEEQANLRGLTSLHLKPISFPPNGSPKNLLMSAVILRHMLGGVARDIHDVVSKRAVASCRPFRFWERWMEGVACLDQRGRLQRVAMQHGDGGGDLWHAGTTPAGEEGLRVTVCLNGKGHLLFFRPEGEANAVQGEIFRHLASLVQSDWEEAMEEAMRETPYMVAAYLGNQPGILLKELENLFNEVEPKAEIKVWLIRDFEGILHFVRAESNVVPYLMPGSYRAGSESVPIFLRLSMKAEIGQGLKYEIEENRLACEELAMVSEILKHIDEGLRWK